MHTKSYPYIGIRSRNELAKRIKRKNFSYNRAILLINNVVKNFDKYWKDSSRSEIARGKYVRTAKGKPLGILLERINLFVLAPYDSMLPGFIFGGVTGTNHIKAVVHLQGKKHKRVLLKADISTFFEQITIDRVTNFFQYQCGCSWEIAHLLGNICCVPLGAKDSGNNTKTIGRGFATSSRLAIWCNLNIFTKLNFLVQRRLKGKDPRLAIYVDDIGITATRVSKSDMDKLYLEIKELFSTTDRNQKLPLNDSKKKVISHEEGLEHLGIEMRRNSLSIGVKSKAKINKLQSQLTKQLTSKEILKIKSKKRAIRSYQKYVENS
jgi:hypothetical protein